MAVKDRKVPSGNQDSQKEKETLAAGLGLAHSTLHAGYEEKDHHPSAARTSLSFPV